MRRLLVITAVIEVPTGLALLLIPALVVRFLIGGEISGTAIPLGRVAGVALIALGVANWLASFDAASCTARGVATAMVIYNLGIAAIFFATGVRSSSVAIGLWPAVGLHAAMGILCLTSLLSTPALRSNPATK
jgi:hypothetical protein